MIAHLKQSLTFRLAFMFSLSAFVVLLLLGFAVIYVINQHFISQDRMALATQNQHITHELDTANSIEQIPSLLINVIANNAHNEHGFSSFIIHNSQIVFNSTPSQTDLTDLTNQLINLSEGLHTLQQGDNSYRLLSQPITIAGEKATLMVALNINHHQRFLIDFRQSMWLTIGIAALLMGLLACLVAKKGLKPLHILMDQTTKINVNNLSQSLPVHQTYLEISQLTATFNDMLDRLHHSFQRLIDFSSDLAHELRTPLSSMKMQNQVILSRPRNADEYQQALQDNAQALDQMTKMVNDMLFLAKSDHGLIYPEVTPIILNDEITSLFDFYDYLAQEKGMTLQISGHGKLYGDKSLLRRALSNLITNAIHYGDNDSVIKIAISEQAKTTQITITNQGDTIDEKHLPHLFERFYRLDSSRTQSPDGVGLGLAITAAIISAHQGEITVTSKDRQTCFNLRFNNQLR